MCDLEVEREPRDEHVALQSDLVHRGRGQRDREPDVTRHRRRVLLDAAAAVVALVLRPEAAKEENNLK